MTRVIVLYWVKPDRVEQNEELVRAVYEEVHRAGPSRSATGRCVEDAGE
jgi:hypothetical protein